MDKRKRRIALNEAVFREANEALSSLQGPQGEARLLDLLCECGNPDCVDKIEMSIEAYEWLRADPARFALVSGHEQPDVETIIQRHQRYDVVEKHAGESERVAKATNPRSN